MGHRTGSDMQSDSFVLNEHIRGTCKEADGESETYRDTGRRDHHTVRSGCASSLKCNWPKSTACITWRVWGIVHNKTYKHVDRLPLLPAVPKKRREFHGHHGLEGNTYTRTYSSWKAMIQRCENPNCPAFKWYGARGITICDRWRNSFTAFLADTESALKAHL